MTTFFDRVDILRSIHYRQTAETQIHTIEEALQFINDVGFCLFCGHRHIELPNLCDATAGDAATREGLNWRWKDELASQRLVFYSKPFRGKPGFVALDVLPALYAVSPVAEYGGDHQELAWHGKLSAEARQIATSVLEQGPITTRSLRQMSGLAAQKNAYRFARGLAEAQAKLLIAMTSTTSTSRAGYSYIWESFQQAWPQAVEAGEVLSRIDATGQLIMRYIRTVAAATADSVTHTLALERWLVDESMPLLVKKGTLIQVHMAETTYFTVPGLL
jgi:hypothetical protein